jgi:site-specific DNA-methyltransferase (adenine-specific)
MAEYKVMLGDCLESMKTLPDKCIDTCVTSPPYFGLRNYGDERQIGLEEMPEDFIVKLVEVFREVKRVLRDDGTLWLNLGDSYWNNFGGGSPTMTTGNAQAVRARGRSNKPKHDLFKIKDLIGIPWRVAFALQQDGWYLRQDIIWHKPNPMPESVTDRCTKSHEYIFLLSKSSKYYFDSEAMQQPSVGGGTRNRRSVWTVSTKPFKGAHFATFPPELIEPCILSGCPVGGTVLDPFGGSGTTAGVAVSNDRNAIICELNPEYASLVEDRVKHISFNKKTLL